VFGNYWRIECNLLATIHENFVLHSTSAANHADVCHFNCICDVDAAQSNLKKPKTSQNVAISFCSSNTGVASFSAAETIKFLRWLFKFSY